MLMRSTTPVEKAVFRMLDILHKEKKTNYKQAIKRKWPGMADEDVKNMINWWNINQNENGDYNTIITNKD